VDRVRVVGASVGGAWGMGPRCCSASLYPCVRPRVGGPLCAMDCVCIAGALVGGPWGVGPSSSWCEGAEVVGRATRQAWSGSGWMVERLF
jgi:hypothetical protein